MKDKSIRVEFEDGSTAIMHTNCRGCGKKVDKALRIVSMEHFRMVYCWDCIEKKMKIRR